MSFKDSINYIKQLKYKQVAALMLNPHVWMWVFPLLLIIPNVGLCITEFNSLMAKLTNIVLPFGVYLLLMTWSRKVGRTMLLCLPIMILSAFQIVLFFLFGQSIIAIDMFMNVVTTNPAEATELLGNLKVAILTVCAFYLPPICVGVYMVIKKRRLSEPAREKGRKAGVFITVIGLVMMLFTWVFVDGFKPTREIFPYNVMSNVCTAVSRVYESMNYHKTSASFSYTPMMTREKELVEIYVVILGETSRAANWQLLGYDRETNPRLSGRSNLVAFDKVLSEINTTHKSVPMLLSYLTSENFGDSVAHTRSVFSAFNDLGYQTAFISNQRRNHSYIDFYGSEARTVNFISDRGGPQLDMNLVEPLKKIIATSPSHKIFVVLHAYGSHFEYRKRYTPDMAYFTPEHNSQASADNRQELINAYDNTIRYTDMFINEVIKTLEETGEVASVIYVSDHGEDIFDDERKRFLHSSPVPTANQIHVPMLVWTSDKFNEMFPERTAALKANKSKDVSSSISLFHTVIDMAGIKTPFYDNSKSLMSPGYSSPRRRYLNDYNESVELINSGLWNIDIDVLGRRGISVD
ncbi:MAG: sulfatase-like hydrolase/transferase [Muribaculaceae bacterium]|nr:sulfatase-like hydrolase/transferase [Muribaculaceae bacterium]